MNRAARYLGSALALAGLIALAMAAGETMQSTDLHKLIRTESLAALAGAAFLSATGVPFAALAWQRLLRMGGTDRRYRELLALTAVTQAAKYFPGNFAHHLGRMALATNRGIPTSLLTRMFAAELMLLVLTGLAVAAAGLALSPLPAIWLRAQRIHPNAGHTALAVVGLACILLWIVANGATRGRVRQWLKNFSARGVAAVCCAYAAAYLLLGLAAYVVCATLAPQAALSPLVLTSLFALAWTAGFLTPGAPAGLGVREGVLLLVLSPTMPASTAALVALTLRAATICGDIAVFLLGACMMRSLPASTAKRPAPPAQTLRLEPTGERMVLEHYGSTPEDRLIRCMHMAAYEFALPLANEKRVLDYGCGSGYGSSLVASRALRVDGVDVDPESIAYAAGHYRGANLSFRLLDPAEGLPFADGSFDLVLSFQVFEHVASPDLYLKEIVRVLAPGGQLVLITPNRSVRLFHWQRPWNRWHLTEYDFETLESVLARHFPRIELFSMSGPASDIAPELSRYRRLRWLTLAFTWSSIPERWRVSGLGLLARLQRSRKRSTQPDLERTEHATPDIRIDRGLQPALNLVAVCNCAEATGLP